MDRIIYKKLIRDRIPEIIREAGKNPYYRTIEGEALHESIARKIIEEAFELYRELTRSDRDPGCIYCMYACVCGITSNDKANEETWFSDGGIYDTFNLPNDDRNYYAGRYFPKADLSPGKGGAIRIRLTLVK